MPEDACYCVRHKNRYYKVCRRTLYSDDRVIIEKIRIEGECSKKDLEKLPKIEGD
jgi:hypothetical protein